MSITYFIYTLSNTAFFSSRAFLPAFVTALILRFPDAVPFLHLDIQVSNSMQWFISDESLWILGILSLLEMWADKNPGLKDFLDQVDSLVKAVVMVGTSLAVLDSESAGVLKLMEQSGLEPPLAYSAAVMPTWGGIENTIAITWTLLCSTLVVLLNNVRKQALMMVRIVDDNNDIGLVSFFSWIEDFWVLLGVLMLFILPTFTFIVVGIVLACLYLFTKYMQRLEEKQKIACVTCRNLMHPSARHCPVCKAPALIPRDVNCLGLPRKNPAPDTESHALKLISVKRCPTCAARLPERSALQVCPVCQSQVLSTLQDLLRYKLYVQSRLQHVLLLTFLAGFIPVFGAIFSLIYANLLLVRPYSQYVFVWKSIWLRWLARLMIFILVVLQPIPILGSITAPLIVLIYFSVWKKGFERTYRASVQQIQESLSKEKALSTYID